MLIRAICGKNMLSRLARQIGLCIANMVGICVYLFVTYLQNYDKGHDLIVVIVAWIVVQLSIVCWRLRDPDIFNRDPLDEWREEQIPAVGHPYSTMTESQIKLGLRKDFHACVLDSLITANSYVFAIMVYVTLIHISSDELVQIYVCIGVIVVLLVVFLLLRYHLLYKANGVSYTVCPTTMTSGDS